MKDTPNDFDWSETQEYIEIVCASFTENEIEHLEDFADYFMGNGPVDLFEQPLILDTLKEYGDAQS